MRLDKFLKESRLIKRRTVAKEACEQDRVLQNGGTAKAGSKVRPGDELEIIFGERKMKVQVESIAKGIGKDGARAMYRIIE